MAAAQRLIVNSRVISENSHPCCPNPGFVDIPFSWCINYFCTPFCFKQMQMVPYADIYLYMKKKSNTGIRSLEIIQGCGFLVCLLSVFCFSHSWVHHISLVCHSIKYCRKCSEIHAGNLFQTNIL